MSFDCVYCNKPCLAEHELCSHDQHVICMELKERRYIDRACVRCGSKDGEHVQCDRCRMNPNAPFVGFDGPPGNTDVSNGMSSEPKTVLDSCRRCGHFRSVLADATRLCSDCI